MADYRDWVAEEEADRRAAKIAKEFADAGYRQAGKQLTCLGCGLLVGDQTIHSATCELNKARVREIRAAEASLAALRR